MTEVAKPMDTKEDSQKDEKYEKYTPADKEHDIPEYFLPCMLLTLVEGMYEVKYYENSPTKQSFIRAVISNLVMQAMWYCKASDGKKPQLTVILAKEADKLLHMCNLREVVEEYMARMKRSLKWPDFSDQKEYKPRLSLLAEECTSSILALEMHDPDRIVRIQFITQLEEDTAVLSTSDVVMVVNVSGGFIRQQVSWRLHKKARAFFFERNQKLAPPRQPYTFDQIVLPPMPPLPTESASDKPGDTDGKEEKKGKAGWTCGLCDEFHSAEMGFAFERCRSCKEPRRLAPEACGRATCKAQIRPNEARCSTCGWEYYWSCEACTIRNTQSHVMCRVCGTPNSKMLAESHAGALYNQEPTGFAFTGADIPTSSRKRPFSGIGADDSDSKFEWANEPNAKARNAQASWLCVRCNYRNPGGQATCQGSDKTTNQACGIALLWDCPECFHINKGFGLCEKCKKFDRLNTFNTAEWTWTCPNCKTCNPKTQSHCRGNADRVCRVSYCWHCPTCSKFNQGFGICSHCKTIDRSKKAPTPCPTCGQNKYTSGDICKECRCRICGAMNYIPGSQCAHCMKKQQIAAALESPFAFSEPSSSG